ncbi:MAG: hypothetical protein RLZZ450_5685, partial [Pseudomonadota bacterium]
GRIRGEDGDGPRLTSRSYLGWRLEMRAYYEAGSNFAAMQMDFASATVLGS